MSTVGNVSVWFQFTSTCSMRQNLNQTNRYYGWIVKHKKTWRCSSSSFSVLCIFSSSSFLRCSSSVSRARRSALASLRFLSSTPCGLSSMLLPHSTAVRKADHQSHFRSGDNFGFNFVCSVLQNNYRTSDSSRIVQ